MRFIPLPLAGGGGPVTHATSGAITGAGSTVAGTAAHVAKHATSGALVGPGSTVSGSATRFRAHPTSGTLAGPGSTVTGSAARTRQHATSGALSGAGASVAGSAQRTGAAVTHSTSGVLTGPGASVSGSAALHARSAQPVGGWIHYGRYGWSREDYERERARLEAEIAPSAKAETVIRRVAKQVVERAKQVDGPGLLETIQARQAQEAQQLKTAMQRAKVAYDDGYARLMLIEAWGLVLQQQRLAEIESEDEQIAMLLMEM